MAANQNIMTVTVPAGAQPGQIISVRSQFDGRQFQVQIPAGGRALNFRMDVKDIRVCLCLFDMLMFAGRRVYLTPVPVTTSAVSECGEVDLNRHTD